MACAVGCCMGQSQARGVAGFGLGVSGHFFRGFQIENAGSNRRAPRIASKHASILLSPCSNQVRIHASTFDPRHPSYQCRYAYAYAVVPPK